MKLSKALKEKNRLIAKISKLKDDIGNNNRVILGNARDYITAELLESYNNSKAELVELKTKIHTASQPIREKIFLISELKDDVKMMKSIPTDSGKQSIRYGSEIVEYEVDFGKADIDKLIERAEDEIMKLQDEIDIFNSTTDIG